MEVTHVKPHGALNNVACVDTATAEAIARAVFGVSPALIMLAPAASELLFAAERQGLRTARLLPPLRWHCLMWHICCRHRIGDLR